MSVEQHKFNNVGEDFNEVDFNIKIAALSKKISHVLKDDLENFGVIMGALDLIRECLVLQANIKSKVQLDQYMKMLDGLHEKSMREIGIYFEEKIRDI